MSGLCYVKVYMEDGTEFAFPRDAWDVLEDAINNSQFDETKVFIKLQDFDGSLRMFRVDSIMHISESTPETREAWGRNNRKIQSEQMQFNAKYSDPLNLL